MSWVASPFDQSTQEGQKSVSFYLLDNKCDILFGNIVIFYIFATCSSNTNNIVG